MSVRRFDLLGMRQVYILCWGKKKQPKRMTYKMRASISLKETNYKHAPAHEHVHAQLSSPYSRAGVVSFWGDYLFVWKPELHTDREKERETERGREKELSHPLAHSTHCCIKLWQESSTVFGSMTWVKGVQTQVVFCCISHAISRELVLKWSSWDEGFQGCRLWLHLLCHEASLKLVQFFQWFSVCLPLGE